MLKYLFYTETKPMNSLVESFLSLYSTPLTWLSPVLAYCVIYFLKKQLTPAWKLFANCSLYLYSIWTALSSFESMNLLPATTLTGPIGHFDRIVRIITGHINNNFTAEKVISIVWFLVVYRFVLVGITTILILSYVTYSTIRLMKKHPKPTTTATATSTTVNVYNHIPTMNLIQQLPTHNGDPILTEEYLTTYDSQINPTLPSSEKKAVFR
jgi:hypothetical protein